MFDKTSHLIYDYNDNDKDRGNLWNTHVATRLRLFFVRVQRYFVPLLQSVYYVNYEKWTIFNLPVDLELFKEILLQKIVYLYSIILHTSQHT